MGDWFNRLRLGWPGSERCRFDSAQRAYVFENIAEVNLFGGLFNKFITTIRLRFVDLFQI